MCWFHHLFVCCVSSAAQVPSREAPYRTLLLLVLTVSRRQQLLILLKQQQAQQQAAAAARLALVHGQTACGPCQAQAAAVAQAHEATAQVLQQQTGKHYSRRAWMWTLSHRSQLL
jgi:hypothetical protein